MVEVKREIAPTEMERNLVQMVADEMTAAQIAQILDVSKRTVEDRKNKIMDRWGCKSFVGVVAIFMRNKLIK